MKFLKYWGPTAGLMFIIFMLSTRTRLLVSDVFAVQFLFFKTLHVLEYALLYVLAYRSLKNTSGETAWKNRYNAFLIAFFYGVSDEIHQVFVPTREGTVRDIFIDSIGITFACIFIWKLLPKAPKKLKNLAKVLELI
jgi:preprotein translocase subunit SecE